MRPDHFYYPVDADWTRIFTFLPLFNFTEAHKISDKVCHDCRLACYIHPLVRDKNDENCFHKLCTAQVIKAGLLNIDIVFLDEDGCGGQDKGPDYQWAKKKFGK